MGLINTAEANRNIYMEIYSTTRSALANLDPTTAIKFPTLTLQDTYMKPTNTRRQLGDSGNHDGLLWHGAAISAGTRLNSLARVAGDEPSGNIMNGDSGHR